MNIFNIQSNDFLHENVTEIVDLNTNFISNPVLKLENTFNVGFVVPNNNNDIITTIMNQKIFNNTTLKAMPFENDDAMEKYYLNNKNSLIAGVIINPDMMSYTLRVDGTSLPNPSILEKSEQKNTDINNSTNYLSIFSPIQMAIDQALIQLKTGDNALEITSNIGKLPLTDFHKTETLGFQDSFNAFYIEYIFILPVIPVIYYIVTENEKNVKSYLITIGIHPSSFWLSWFISSIIYFIFLIGVMCFFFLLFNYFSILNTLVFFVLSFLFSVSLVAYSLLFASFFKDTKIANSCADIFSLLFICSFILFSFCSQTVNDIVKFILSPVPIGHALEKLLYYNKLGKTAKFFTDKDLLLNAVVLIWDSILYFILAIIVDAIFSEENQSFISFNKKPKSTLNYNPESPSPYEKDIEEYHGKEENYVEVKNIFREYNIKKKNILALNNVSFKAYKDEIFCILGHNGAGKSTLVKIMTGLIRSNYGSIIYDGLSFSKNHSKVRQNMGICMQDNIFFDLSVKDNLKIFNSLKGVKDNVDEVIEKVGLKTKKDTFSENLSGGQKRKLCIGIAILGNPKYLFLDEPSTGLDPVSRRNVWELLSSLKKDKIIFLTTHYMDEADILSDRKLILSNGVIRCMGTSVYLKNHFNMMYHLGVQTNYFKEINQLIQNIIPTAIHDENRKTIDSDDENNNLSNDKLESQNSFMWKLPINTTPQFKQLFNELNQQKMSNMVTNYTINSPSLEELFISLTENMDEIKDTPSDKESEVLLIKDYPKLPDPSNLVSVPSSTKLKRLITIRYKVYFRNMVFLFNIACIPIIISIIVFVTLKYFAPDGIVHFEEKDISSNAIYQESVWNYDTLHSNLADNIFNNATIHPKVEFNDINLFNHFNQSSLYSREFVASISGTVNNSNQYSFDLYYNETKLHSVPSMANQVSNIVLKSKNIDDNIHIKTHPFPHYDIISRQTTLNIANLLVGLLLIINLMKYGAQVVQERQDLILKQLRLNGINNITYWFASLITDSTFALFSCLIILVVGIIFQYEPFSNIFAILSMLIIIILSTIGSLFFQYCLNFTFKDKKTAYSYLPVINLGFIIIGITGNVFINSFYSILNKDTDIIDLLFNKISVYFQTGMTLIYPSYSVVGIINSLTWIKFLNDINDNLMPLTASSYFNINYGISLMMIAALLSIFFYCILLIILDKKYNILKAKKNVSVPKELKDSYEKYLQEHEQNVYDEAELVRKHYADYPFSVVGINKEFKSESRGVSSYKYTWNYGEVHRSLIANHSKYVKTVIEDVNFRVKSHECFGLLGPNGSGKSTTLNMLIGVYAPSFGDIYFNGKNITSLNDLTVGYCNQNDILWKELTLREHLEFFLELRGFPQEKIQECATQYIRYCELESHQHKRVTALSGGTKRKLSVLLAVCGYPKNIILDEPTAGVDPCTRRFIWNIIDDIKKRTQSSVIMTTHSMEEAEVLCDRLTILLDGHLSCIGSPEYLTMTYAINYILDVETDVLDEFHKTYFENPEAPLHSEEYVMEKQTNNRCKYYLSKSCAIDKVFDYMEQAKSKKLVNDYIFTGTSLDDVFLDFVKNSSLSNE